MDKAQTTKVLKDFSNQLRGGKDPGKLNGLILVNIRGKKNRESKISASQAKAQESKP